MDIRELKDCPFCGGYGVQCFDFEVYKKYLIWCSSCYATTDLYDTEDEANEAWNRRQNESTN